MIAVGCVLVCCVLLIGCCWSFVVGVVVCCVKFVVGCDVIFAVLFSAYGLCVCSLLLLLLFVAGCMLLVACRMLRIVC